MGYWKNHMATIITAGFAAVLTGLWPPFYDYAPILNFVFIMAVPITWFMALTCWLSQKSADYATNHGHEHAVHQKKSLSNSQTVQVQVPKQVNFSEIKQIGFFQLGINLGIFLQSIGSLKTVPPKIFLIVPFGDRHIFFRSNSLTLCSSGVIVAHLIPTPYFLIARALSMVI